MTFPHVIEMISLCATDFISARLGGLKGKDWSYSWLGFSLKGASPNRDTQELMLIGSSYLAQICLKDLGE